MNSISIVLAEDHHVVRQGLRALLAAEPDFVVVGEAASGLEVAPLVERVKPDVLVVDFVMPGLNAPDIVRRATRLSPRTRAKLDLFTFVFFFIYVGALIWVGSTLAWGSFLEGEGTGTPWNPRIWPVKFAIPVAGVLLLLQGIANLLRDLGIARPESRAS